MLAIFILLLIAMLFVVKFCKKKLKIVLSISIILIALYCIVIFVDMNRVNSFREPIFAISSELRDYKEYSTEVYKGLGYRVEINKVQNQKVISIIMSFFNKVIAASIE